MFLPFQSTGFNRLSRRAAAGALLLTAATMAWFVAVSISPSASGFADKPSRGASDVDLYVAEIQRVAQGETYYAAANTGKVNDEIAKALESIMLKKSSVKDALDKLATTIKPLLQ